MVCYDRTASLIMQDSVIDVQHAVPHLNKANSGQISFNFSKMKQFKIYWGLFSISGL